MFEITNPIIIVITSFLFVLLITPQIRKIAVHIGALDIPNSRKVHSNPTPRLGGLGIFLGFLLGYILFGEVTTVMNSVLIGGFIIVLTGLIDDIKPMKSSTKFFGQLSAALVIVFYGNILLSDINAFGFGLDFGIMAYPITLFFILGCINCLNFIDGLDGLASGVASIYFLTIGIIGMMGTNRGLDLTLAFIMLGSTLGFLKHNFNPASIFMGDSGSMFLGFIISIIALLGFAKETLTSFFVPLIILAIPILDIIFAIIRRIIKGEKISTPDKYHIHHQLLHKNLSQKQVVLIIYAINILFAIASIFYMVKDRVLGYFIYGFLFFIVVLFILKTSIIIDGDRKKDSKTISLHLKNRKGSKKNG